MRPATNPVCPKCYKKGILSRTILTRLEEKYLCKECNTYFDLTKIPRKYYIDQKKELFFAASEKSIMEFIKWIEKQSWVFHNNFTKKEKCELKKRLRIKVFKVI